VIMGTGLVLSASRGGMIATAVALLVMGLLLMARKKQRKKGALILALFLLTSIYALAAGIDYTVDRFKAFDVDMEVRERYAQKATALFYDYRLAGVGAGNLGDSYPKYQDPKDAALLIDYACNDWIQLLAETGITGLLFLFAGMGYFLFVYVRRWLKREDTFAICLGLAPLAALTAIAVHSYSDFNLHQPANFLLLAAIAAIGVAALHLEGRHLETVNLPSARLRLLGSGGPALALLLVLILWSGAWTVRHFVAEAHCNTLFRKSLNLDDNPPVEFIQTAIRWDGGNAAYSFKLANALMQIRDREAQAADADRMKWQQSHEPIIAALERAIRLNPLNAEYHVRLAWEYSYMTHEPDYMKKWLPAADLSMERAAYAAGNSAMNPRLQIDMGHYWTMRSRTLGTAGDLRQDPVWTKALWHYQKAQELIPDKATGKEIMQYVKIFYPDEDQLAQVLLQ
jgi:hypothetical protein